MKRANFSSRQDQWKILISEQKSSGLSQAEFCKRRGIAPALFYSWSSRLKKMGRSENNFIRVEEAKGIEPMRIVFQSGVALHFAQTPDPEWIMEIMRLVS